MTPDQLALIRLLSLDTLGPARCRWLTADVGPAATVEWLLGGQAPALGPSPRGVTTEVIDRWRSLLRERLAQHSDEAIIERYEAAGVSVVDAVHDAWPFSNDPDPPGLLFCRGDLGLLDHRPAVAIVGSRRCTSVGRTVAERLGAELSAMGVAVVSGLALGVDGEAHGGVFKAWAHAGGRAGPPIGVVASGLDVVYPKNHGKLWERVASDGLLVSETPLGVSPNRWRFPARNRIIAALADGVVVVESHEKGGALGTADEATIRGVPVLSVPGSVLNVAADGTNRLLMEGAIPIRHATDVVEALGMTPVPVDEPPIPDEQLALAIGDHPPLHQPPIGHPDLGHLPLSAVDEQICREVTSGSVSMERLAHACDVPVMDIVVATQKLALRGVLVIDGNRVRLP